MHLVLLMYSISAYFKWFVRIRCYLKQRLQMVTLQVPAFWSAFVCLKNMVTFLIKHHSLKIMAMNQYTRESQKKYISFFSHYCNVLYVDELNLWHLNLVCFIQMWHNTKCSMISSVVYTSQELAQSSVDTELVHVHFPDISPQKTWFLLGRWLLWLI